MEALDRLGVGRLDAALTAVLLVAGLVQTAAFPIAQPFVAVLYLAGSTLPMAWRHRFPLRVALVSSAFWLVPLDGYPVLGFVVVILVFYAVGAWGRPDRAVVLTTLAACVVSVVGTLLGPEQPVAAVGGVLAVVTPVVAGRVVRALRDQNADLTRLAAELEKERARAEEVAVAAERARIAQELHDVVGHELTLIAIQAEAAGAALRTAPDRAAEPVEAIRETAHRTLAEIRATLDVLTPRAGGADDGQPADGVEDLVRRAEAAGLSVGLTVSGTPWPSQSPAWLAVNRVVRECLTNAGRHAVGRKVDVTVAWSPDEVVVTAANDADLTRPVGSGRGLTGMRHRAELLGGSFAVCRASGRFEVRVALPAEPVKVAR